MAGEFPNLERNVLTVNNLEMFKKAKKWTRDPILEGEHLRAFEFLEDLNERRLRDAESLGAIAANRNPKTILEIGTGLGYSTTVLAENAPQATVHTVNIPIEEIKDGGNFTTNTMTREQIGMHYRKRGMPNVKQIWANTSTWKPDIGPIDIAFIDGCHDTEFVYNDTAMILPHCHVGSTIMWHDFNLELACKYEWIHASCAGVEKLYADGLLKGRILHLRDSWVGVYIIPRL